jgi:hypothetical protein
MLATLDFQLPELAASGVSSIAWIARHFWDRVSR